MNRYFFLNIAMAAIVLVLLIVIYRSPIFWIIPFFTVLLAAPRAGPEADRFEREIRVSGRRFAERIEVRGEDEISRLATSFNTMLAALEEAIALRRHGQRG